MDIIIPLPYYGYQDNESVQTLLTPIERALQDCITISDWLASPDLVHPLNLLILSIEFDKLDYLASLLGFYGYFWRTEWTQQQKLQLIHNTLYLWENRGSVPVLLMVLDILDLVGDIWTLFGGFICDVSKCDEGSIGEHNPLFAFIRVPLTVIRATQWGDYSYVFSVFAPLASKVTVCYDQFYCDFSVIGEPLFS